MGLWQRLVFNNLDLFWQGFLVTIEICGIAFVVAVGAGLVVCLVRLYVAPLRWLAIFWIEFCRSTPIYVQLMWVSYVWPELFGWPNLAFNAGWTALALQSSGYLAETFRAGIEGVGKGQREAALAVGMTPGLALRRIVLPQAFLTMAPSIMNQVIVLIKSSTLVSVIAVPDLLYQAMKLVNTWFEPVEILSFTALVYILFVTVLSFGLKRLSDGLRLKYGS
jgi:polar amino acid transport system permease protein